MEQKQQPSNMKEFLGAKTISPLEQEKLTGGNVSEDEVVGEKEKKKDSKLKIKVGLETA